MGAFYGCLAAGVVPVPIEVPLTKRVSSVDNHAFKKVFVNNFFI